MVHIQNSLASVPAASPIGSGALSHAYIQVPPLLFRTPGTARLIYDDANKLLLVLSPNKVLSWAVNHKPPPRDPSVTSLAEGPVLFVRFSLDETILAVQRSGQEVEFINKGIDVVFHQRCKQGTDQVLGLFWTDCPTCDVVFVTSSGMELYMLSDDRTGLKLTELKKLHVSWYVYTHESRLVLLASGMQCKTLTGYQFSAGGIIRLPKFDVSLAKAELNSRPVLSFQDVHIATMYGRLYCLQVDRVALELHLYRFYRDAVEPEGFLPIYSGNVALSIVDNVLLIHEIDSKVVVLYDIMLNSKVPISAPLTLLARGVPSYASLRTAFESRNGRRISSLEFNHLENPIVAEATVYDSGWVFANPNIVLDHARGHLWKIHLDLEAIAASSSDILSLLAFLQRRSHEARKAKLLSMEVLRSMIIERQPLPLIARAMDVITSSYARAVKLTSDSKKSNVSKPAQPTHAVFQGPREFDVIQAPLPCSVLQTVQETTKDNVESSVVYVDVEASARGWAQYSLVQNDGKSHGTISRVENMISNSLTTLGSHHETKRNLSKAASSKVEPEIDGFTVLSPSHAHSALLGEISGRPWQQSHAEIFVTEYGELTGAVSPSMSPKEMQHSVFNAIEKDMIVDSTFLIATVIEYMLSAAAEHIGVNPGLHVVIIQLLSQQQQYYELWQLIVGKVVPPSKAVALQLLEVGSQDLSMRKLGMDMLRQLHGHNDYVNVLLREGHILEAICHVHQSEVNAVAPAVFLEAANALKDPEKLASVFRFYLDCVPDFTRTSDFSMYLSTLKL